MIEYTKVDNNLNHMTAALPESFQWEITEKIDGSNFRADFGRWEFGSRRTKLNLEKVGMRNFKPFAEWANSLQESTKKALQRNFAGYVFIGEAFGQGKNTKKARGNKLEYDRAPISGVVWYDVFCKETEEYVTGEKKLVLLDDLATCTGMETVPSLLVDNTTVTEELIKEHMYRSSMFGGEREGIVIAPFTNNVYSKAGKRCIFKSVCPEFSEKVGKQVKLKTDQGQIQNIADELLTDMRIQKAITRIQEEGTWNAVNPNSNIGNVIKVISADIVEEERGAIEAALWKLFTKRLGGRIGEKVREFMLKEAV
nr:hypothetical protein 12 [Deltaproteobacteria bacterium]